MKSYDMPWSERLIPNFFIRLRRVLGCNLRILAAPFGPSITPLVCLSTARIWCFSTASSVSASSGTGLRGGMQRTKEHHGRTHLGILHGGQLDQCIDSALP